MSSLRGGFPQGGSYNEDFLRRTVCRALCRGGGRQALSSSRPEADRRPLTAVHGGRGAGAWVEGRASFGEEDRL